MTYCKRFDNSCYHHQCIAMFVYQSWLVAILEVELRCCSGLLLCTDDDNRSYRNVCNMSFTWCFYANVLCAYTHMRHTYMHLHTYAHTCTYIHTYALTYSIHAYAHMQTDRYRIPNSFLYAFLILFLISMLLIFLSFAFFVFILSFAFLLFRGSSQKNAWITVPTYLVSTLFQNKKDKHQACPGP